MQRLFASPFLPALSLLAFALPALCLGECVCSWCPSLGEGACILGAAWLAGAVYVVLRPLQELAGLGALRD